MKINNIYENLEYNEIEEVVTNLFEDDNVNILRIASFNQTTDWMEDKRKEVAILLEGEAKIEFKDRTLEIKKGDVIYINPLESHRVINISPDGLWLCVYFT